MPEIIFKIKKNLFYIFLSILLGFLLGIGCVYLYNTGPVREESEIILAEENPIKVSVIIPVYNTAPYLERCLDSAINQTLKDIEIICVNDGSTDNSLEILQKYAEKDKRVKVINFEKNQGVSSARNTAIKEAKGEFIAFLDSDDFIGKQYIKHLYTESNGSFVVKGPVATNGWYCPLFYKFDYHTYGMVSRKFLLDHNINFPENMNLKEDRHFYMALKDKGAYFNRIYPNGKETFYFRERRLNSLSTRWLHTEKDLEEKCKEKVYVKR